MSKIQFNNGVEADIEEDMIYINVRNNSVQLSPENLERMMEEYLRERRQNRE
ncbi:ATP-binding protein [Halogranum rubrum]|uniref:Uncharacterized protein n=1 Tax=Halogranum salarium B-1 TaxID=1210908 RepID=J3ETA8_9EURY|nr:ATP-binding protein [Halogranum salarium]EJN57332.1 hypothetical protein HSB1_42950 [Halogranum salarium B-1]